MENGKSTAVMKQTDTMLAVQMHGYGGSEVLKFEETRRPVPGEGEILVRVFAAGVNPIDYKVRQGFLKQYVNYQFPLILGWEFSGLVDSLGNGSRRFREGDEVYCKSDTTRNGAYAEFVVVRESDVEFKPRTINHIQAGGIPLAGLTAWQALFEVARLQAGQSILIHGASGGVGHFAVQFAKWCDAYVIGTASKENENFVRHLGADKVIDYKSQRFEEEVKGVDVVLDSVGGDVQNRSFKVLSKGGILVSIVSQPSEQLADKFGVRQTYLHSHPSASQLGEIGELVDSDLVKPAIEKVLPLSQARHAHDIIQTGHARGKIVLQVL